MQGLFFLARAKDSVKLQQWVNFAIGNDVINVVVVDDVQRGHGRLG